MEQKVIIVGAGSVGLSCAYYLHKNGFKVTVIDEHDISDGASFGNAGFISPFKKYPLSHPGIIGKTLRLILKGKSPLEFYPSLDKNIYEWLFKFAANANQNRLRRTLYLFEKYGEQAILGYEKICTDENLDFDFHRLGSLLVFTQENSFKQRLRVHKDSQEVKLISKEQTVDYIPFLKDNIEGAFWIDKNAHIDPALYMKNMKDFLQKDGVEFVLNEEIIDIEKDGSKITKVFSKNKSFSADLFVFSTGYKTKIAKKAGCDLGLIPTKGYSVTFKIKDSLKPKIPALLNDLFVVITPRKNDIRITSKLEIGAKDSLPNDQKIDKFIKNLTEYCIDFEMKDEIRWAGFRPLTPNDMPLIGRDENLQNLLHANGLGWLGLTFAPAIGEIIAKMAKNNLSNTECEDILLFSGFWQ